MDPCLALVVVLAYAYSYTAWRAGLRASTGLAAAVSAVLLLTPAAGTPCTPVLLLAAVLPPMLAAGLRATPGHQRLSMLALGPGVPLLVVAVVYAAAQARYSYYPSDQWIVIGVAKNAVWGRLDEYTLLTRYYTLYGEFLAALGHTTEAMAAADMFVTVTLTIPLLVLAYIDFYRVAGVDHAVARATLTLMGGGLIALALLAHWPARYMDYLALSFILNDGYRGDYFLTTAIWSYKALGTGLATAAALLTLAAAETRLALMIAPPVLLAAARTYLPALLAYSLTLAAATVLRRREPPSKLLYHAALVLAAYSLLGMAWSPSYWRLFLEQKIGLVTRIPAFNTPLLDLVFSSSSLALLALMLMMWKLAFPEDSVGQRRALVLLLAILALLATLYSGSPLGLAAGLLHYAPLLALALLTRRGRPYALYYTAASLLIALAPGGIGQRLYLALKPLIVAVLPLNARQGRLAMAAAVLVTLSMLSFPVFAYYSVLAAPGAVEARSAYTIANWLDNLGSNKPPRVLVCTEEWIVDRLTRWLLGVKPDRCSSLLQALGDHGEAVMLGRGPGWLIGVESLTTKAYYAAILQGSRRAEAEVIALNSSSTLRLSASLGATAILLVTSSRDAGSGEIIALITETAYIRVVAAGMDYRVVVFDGSKPRTLTLHPMRLGGNTSAAIVIPTQAHVVLLGGEGLYIIDFKAPPSNTLTAYFKSVPPGTTWKPWRGSAEAVLLVCHTCTPADKVMLLADILGRKGLLESVGR